MARRWTIEEEAEKRRELENLYINQNKTIKEISKILGIRESSVFKRMQRLNVSSIPEKKHHFLNKRTDIIFPNFSNKLAEFFGIMLGDGHINSGQIWIYINKNEDKEYTPYIKELLKSLFGVGVKCIYREKYNIINLFISSVDLVKYLNKKGLFIANKVKFQVDLPSWILSNNSYKKAFLRGFFDTDGSIYKLKFGVQMSFSNRSLPLLQSIKRILSELKYHPSKISSYKVYLTRKFDLKKYAEEIGFSNLKHFKRAEKFGIL